MPHMTIKMTEEEYTEHREAYDGVCLSCGKYHFGGIEPDARGYECGECGEHEVYGVEEAFMMGCIEME